MNKVLIFGLVAVLVVCLALAAGVWLVAQQMGIHLPDKSQVPVITVSGGLRPTISFTPDTAYELNVYEGDKDGDGFGVIWHATGPGGYENNLRSPVVYGVPPEGSAGQEAPPLEPGQTYTVTVYRKDPKGGGDGFFNTRRRYDGLVTFAATGE